MSIETVATEDSAVTEAGAATDYSRQIGDRLRRIRRQQRLSLLEVEQRSNQEFKASVLGAYERGERVVSVPRLDRLATFYGVPIEQLLQRESSAPRSVAHANGVQTKLAIDVVKLSQLQGPSFEALTRYLRSIQAQRQDFGADVVTVRRDDVCSIAAMIAVPTVFVTARLAELGVLSTDAG
jgi:transcriptional regulator with XRE-family HTH domain